MSDTSIKMETVKVIDLGLIDYKVAWDLQQDILDRIVEQKISNRALPTEAKKELKHHFLFCEHPPVYTLGRSGESANLLINEEEMFEKGISFYKINRGGDITFHGPGQIVGYPILDLDSFFTDIHKYVRYIEEAVIRTLSDFGMKGKRIAGASGVWLDATDQLPERKICAIGIHLRRWVTMHGFAFNVNTDLSYYDYIIPCGLTNRNVTSMERELGEQVDVEKVKQLLLKNFGEIFEFQVEGSTKIY